MRQLTAYLLMISLLCGGEGALAGSDKPRLEDLGADLLEPASMQKFPPLDEPLLEQLGLEILGDDLGIPRSANHAPLAQVVAHMQEAGELLKRLQDSTRASSVQGQALKELDVMISELAEKKSRCSGASCDKPSSTKSGKNPSKSSKPGKTAAAAASGETSHSEEIPATLRAVGDLVKGIWGHLPERQREQILQPLSGEFLPQYSVEIEAYFRDLAEP